MRVVNDELADAQVCGELQAYAPRLAPRLALAARGGLYRQAGGVKAGKVCWQMLQ
jgi:hypothetical protein